ncbi:phage holin [Clostridium sp.]|uniref:phage holin n=1 Tax=Clostridium sp. TaxID=1506 RepID=UPI0025BF4C31|nr:phage holin [Clostridium sp.]
MKLDIKARLRNKYFWVSMLSLVVLLLDQLGIKLPVDINEIGGTILSMAVLLGIIVDNGSEGFLDKDE